MRGPSAGDCNSFSLFQWLLNSLLFHRPCSSTCSCSCSRSSLVPYKANGFDAAAQTLTIAFDARAAGRIFRDPQSHLPLPDERVFIMCWVDCCNKCGIGYASTDGSVGVHFNDSTSLVLSRDKVWVANHFLWWWEHDIFILGGSSIQLLADKGDGLCSENRIRSRCTVIVNDFQLFLTSNIFIQSLLPHWHATILFRFHCSFLELCKIQLDILHHSRSRAGFPSRRTVFERSSKMMDEFRPTVVTSCCWRYITS